MADIDFSAVTGPTSWTDTLFKHAIGEGWTDMKVRLHRDDEIVQTGQGESKAELVIHARINRTMQEVASLSGKNAESVVNRIKSVAGIKTGPAIAPVDGLYPYREVEDETVLNAVDIRVAVFPTHVGETITLRFPTAAVAVSIHDLGLSEHNFMLLQRILGIANGLVLLAGPMGAGKSTTMRAVLAEFGGTDKSVWTVEDPVELTIEGVEQIGINADAGNGWPDVLRGLRRSDLEVLMIGEIRDYEQASAALEIGNAGAKVLSSIHANDNVGAVQQLMELSGKPPRTLGNQLRGVVSQRLIRTFHTDCGGSGCEGCAGSGYKGVAPVHEILIIDDDFINALAAGATTGELRATAIERGMRTLRMTAQELIDGARTDEKEVQRVLGND